VQQPEAGLHPELLPPLAELILTAAKDTQVVVVTHATDLAVQLGRQAADHRLDVNATELVKDERGQTVVAGREGPLDQPPWHWPKR
jgi:predicted ATPase